MQSKRSFLSLMLYVFLLCYVNTLNAQEINVAYKGALKNIMHQNDITAKADLTTYKDSNHLFGLGALENLKGEILVLDGNPHISLVRDQKLVINNSFDHKAALWVSASVKKWKTNEIPENITSYEDFEEYVEKMAAEIGIDTDKPFPFLLSGVVKTIDWHVVNWKDGDTEHSHEKHIQSGPNGTLHDTEVEILGFYSKHHHAIFTHHTTNMHLHFKTRDNEIAGHLDQLVLGSDMILKLPR